MVNRLDNLASIIKAKKEQERAEYDALPEVVIDCAVHGEQHVKLMPGQEADRIECPLCVEERRRFSWEEMCTRIAELYEMVR